MKKYGIRKEKEFGCTIFSVYNTETNARVNYFSNPDDAIAFADKSTIKNLIETKRKALSEALRLADECKDYAPDFAAEEAQRAKRLQRQITQLQESLKQ